MIKIENEAIFKPNSNDVAVYFAVIEHVIMLAWFLGCFYHVTKVAPHCTSVI